MSCCRLLKRELSLLVLLCTLMVFLVSAPAGPYSAVHGPVTALRALQAFIVLLLAIAAAALKLALTFPRFFTARWCSPLGLGSSALPTPGPTANLRC